MNKDKIIQICTHSAFSEAPMGMENAVGLYGLTESGDLYEWIFASCEWEFLGASPERDE